MLAWPAVATAVGRGAGGVNQTGLLFGCLQAPGASSVWLSASLLANGPSGNIRIRKGKKGAPVPHWRAHTSSELSALLLLTLYFSSLFSLVIYLYHSLIFLHHPVPLLITLTLTQTASDSMDPLLNTVG